MNYQEFISMPGGTNIRLPQFLQEIVDEAYYTPANIAELTMVSRQTVYNWFKSKQLKSVSVTSRKVVLGADLKEFLFQLISSKQAA